MFAATFNPGTLTSPLQTVNALVDECKLNISDNGMQITSVDPANVAMIDVRVPDTVFETYEAREHTIGVDLNRLLDILALFSSEEDESAKVTLDEETRKLLFECGGLNYKLALLDPDSIRAEPDIPELDLSSETVLESDDFSRVIRACNMVADHMTFAANDSGTFIGSATGDTDDVRVTFEEDDVVDMDPGEAESMFSIEYLSDIDSEIPSDVNVSVQVGDEYPLMLEFSVCNGGAPVFYMLAPRITSN